jgi:ferredoxin--NADP+ reductase
LRFRSGEFVMIGLLGDNGKPLLRAYSIASPAWDEELEFYSIKVPDGPLTSKLQHIQPGDEIILRPKPVGTLVHDALHAWQAAVVSCHRHRHRALRKPDARARDLREV